MLIANYGLYWRRNCIYWGRPNSDGHLKAHRASQAARNAQIVDFRKQQGIYVLYDDGFQIVYAGQAGSGSNNLFDRLKQHCRDHLADRWSRVSWFGTRRVLGSGELSTPRVQSHPTQSEVLDHIEAILIAAAEPPLNKQGGRFGKSVEQFLQYVDGPALNLDTEQMIRRLYEQQFDSG
jgi:hypothetical protein